MSALHIVLALLVTVVWGLNFIFIKWGLEDFPPLLFCALRFALAALPLVFLRGPLPAPLWRIVQIGILLGVIKFGLLFVGMHVGMPAGLSSLVIQSQVFFTVLIAALLLGERPTLQVWIGLALALVGLLLIGWQQPWGGSLLGFILVLASALAWALSNIATKRSGASDMLRLICWVSIVPVLPLLLLSYWFEGLLSWQQALGRLDWEAVGALLYISLVATSAGFALWSFLLQQYPASVVAPFALAVPISGLFFGSWLLGERLSVLDALACVLVFIGLALSLLPQRLTDAGLRVKLLPKS